MELLKDLKPASELELKNLEGVIYGIYNKKKSLIYIGQTYKSFWKRYVSGKWWKFTKNPILKNVKNLEDFEIYIFEEGKTLEELNDLESTYIEMFNSIYPRGYNFQTGLKNKGPTLKSTKSRISDARSKKVILYKNGEKVVIENLKKFCKKNNIGYSGMCNLLSGRSKSSHGYTTSPKTKASLKRENLYVFFHEKYGDFPTNSIKDFCEKFNLIDSSVRGLITDYVSSYRGWKIDKSRSNFKVNSMSKKGGKYRYIKIKNNETNEIKEFHNTKDLSGFLGKHKNTVISWICKRKTSIKDWEVLEFYKN